MHKAIWCASGQRYTFPGAIPGTTLGAKLGSSLSMQVVSTYMQAPTPSKSFDDATDNGRWHALLPSAGVNSSGFEASTAHPGARTHASRQALESLMRISYDYAVA